ncbi:sterol carrier protein domain-containing protein [Kitasatospora sp. NPDC088548]|uniref:sterol carrier protein domain-containing protein n=1 Tax=Kitasatospora sp. NPDC088548 TaxID=3364075 RepID=UPI0037F5F36F
MRLLDADRARPAVEAVYDGVRRTRTGWPRRTTPLWDVRLYDEPRIRDGATALRHAVHHDVDGTPTGYALYRLKSAARQAFSGNGDAGGGTVRVVELAAASPQAYARLWGHLIGVDLFDRLTHEGAVDEALPYLLRDPRALRSTVVDRLWVRLVDVARALAARPYVAPVETVIEVEDAFCPWNTGRYLLRAGAGRPALCERTDREAELALPVADLGSAYLGGTALASLAGTGRVRESRPGALAALDTALRAEGAPFCPGGESFPVY